MASVFFSSLDVAEIVDVEFLTSQVGARPFRLLVDSGYTGASSVILAKDSIDVVRAQIPATQTSGALSAANLASTTLGTTSTIFAPH